MKCLALIPLISLLAACGGEWTPPPTRYISLAIDHTDQHLVGTLAEDMPEILATLGLDEDPWGAITVRVRTIGPVPNDRVQEISLEAADPGETNIVQRRSRMKRFRVAVEEMLRGHLALQPEAAATMFYTGVANELNYLAGREGRRLLLVYSDALEHSGGMNMYKDPELDSLLAHPERYHAYCDGLVQLENLTGIEVVLANVAKNNQNGLRVLKAFDLASSKFKAHGARMRSTGNFIKSELVSHQ